MKWSPQWGGFIVERDDDYVAKTSLNCKAGDVVFFNEPGAIMRGHPIAIRRKGSEQVESLHAGHAALWQSLSDGRAHAGTRVGRVGVDDRVPHSDTVEGMRMLQEAASKHMLDSFDAMINGVLERKSDLFHGIMQIAIASSIEPAPPEPPAVSDDPDVYQRAYHAIVGSTHVRADVDIVLPIDDSNQMRAYRGIRHSDDRLDVYLGEEEPITLVPSARRLHGVLTLAPQSGFCSSGNKIYGAMPDD